MPKDGRRGVKRAERVAKEAGVVIKDETGMDRATFDEVYRVLEETSERDGFTPHSADVYWTMLTTLGEQARMYVARLDGRPVVPPLPWWVRRRCLARFAAAGWAAGSQYSPLVCVQDAGQVRPFQRLSLALDSL